MVVFDTNFLLLLLEPNLAPPAGVTMGRERVEHLLERLSAAGTVVLVPAPVLAEVMTKGSGATQGYLDVLRTSGNIRVAPFDAKAAVECGTQLSESLASMIQAGFSRTGVKFDQMILAIARSEGADRIYTNDKGLRAAAARVGYPTVSLEEVELPAEARQTSLGLGDGQNADQE